MMFFLLSAYQVDKRHKFLERLITVKEEEVTSHENIHTCLLTVTVCVLMFSFLEVATYFLYLNMVKTIMDHNIFINKAACVFVCL